MHHQEFYHCISQQLVAIQNSINPCRKLATRNVVQKELLQRLSKAKQFIDEMEMDALCIDAIAQQTLLSPSHFYRLFRQVYRQSPYHYHLCKRLEKAHRELLTGSVNVTETAIKFGFADIASFSKAYKKQYNVAPTKTISKAKTLFLS
jgi:AraC-like DNA-binding protein